MDFFEKNGKYFLNLFNVFEEVNDLFVVVIWNFKLFFKFRGKSMICENEGGFCNFLIS